MTERWHRTSALVGLPGMPKSARPINHHGPRRGWISRRVNGHAQALEWLESSLPPETQAAISGEASAACALNPVSRLDARVEIVTAFDAWRPRDTALVPALKKWCALYKESGAGVSTETRAAIPGVAWNTLQRWRSAIRANGSSALLAGRGGRRSAIDESADLAAYVESHVRRNPRHVTARNIQRAVLAEFGAELSISQVRRWVRSWRAANGFALSAGEPDRHRSRTQPAFGDAAAEISALNGLWELDSTRVDVMCADGRRHAIVAAIDVWSRRAKVLVTPQSRGTAIAALIRNCMLAWGVPDCIRTDEGARLHIALPDARGGGSRDRPRDPPPLQPREKAVCRAFHRHFKPRFPDAAAGVHRSQRRPGPAPEGAPVLRRPPRRGCDGHLPLGSLRRGSSAGPRRLV